MADVLMLSRLHRTQQVCGGVAAAGCAEVLHWPSGSAVGTQCPKSVVYCLSFLVCACPTCAAAAVVDIGMTQELAAKAAPNKGFKHKHQQQPVTRALIVLPYLSIGARCAFVCLCLCVWMRAGREGGIGCVKLSGYFVRWHGGQTPSR